jgi:hypothetical protein
MLSAIVVNLLDFGPLHIIMLGGVILIVDVDNVNPVVAAICP